MAASLLAGLLGCAVYLNSLNGQFVIDDNSAVRTNADLRPETPLHKLLVNDFWGRPIDAITSVKSYRPLTVLTFRANFALHGLDVFYYHAVNVVLHGACSAAVYACTIQVLRTEHDAALSAALAFAVHPVHTEAVASIVGRAEVLCCLLYLLTLISYQAACRAKSTLGAAFFSFVACGFAVLSTAAKETGMTALLAAVAFDMLDVLVVGSRSKRCLAACATRSTLLVSLTAVMFKGSCWLRGARLSPYFSFVDNPFASLPTRFTRALSALHVHVRYARLLLWPSSLSADYSFDCVPAVNDWWDGRNIASASLYMLLAWVGYGAVCHMQRGSSRCEHPTCQVLAAQQVHLVGGPDAVQIALAKAVALIIIPAIPASHLLVDIGTLVAERLMYTPSVGYCMLLGVAWSVVARALTLQCAPSSLSRLPVGVCRWARRLWLLFGLCALIMGGAWTWTRNADWANSDSITLATVSACAGSAKAQVSLGTLHLQRGDFDLAKAAFRAALAIHVENADALYWLGRLAFMKSELSAAEPLLHAALHLNAGHSEALLFAALCAARREEDKQALHLLRQAYELSPHNSEIVRDYGAMLVRTRQPAAAVPLLSEAVKRLQQLHDLGGGSAHSRSALASARVKLAAAHMLLNSHAECVSETRAVISLDSSLQSTTAPLQQLCQRAFETGEDTSAVRLELGL